MPTLENIALRQQNIEQILTEFKQLFSEKFFKKAAKQLQTLPPSDAEKIFNDLWLYMEVGADADSKEKLDRYFETIKSETIQLKEHQNRPPQISASPIAGSCKALTIRLNWLHRCGLTDMFVEMISVYHWLAAQKLFYKQMAYHQLLLDELRRANDELQKKQIYIDLVAQRFLEIMHKKGHLLSQAEWIMLEKNPLMIIKENCGLHLDEIDKKLALIPTALEIKELFEQIKKQGEASEDEKILSQAQSKFIAKIVQDIEKLSAQLLVVYRGGAPCHLLSIASNVDFNYLRLLAGNLSEAAFAKANVSVNINAISESCKKMKDKDTADKVAAWVARTQEMTVLQASYASDFVDQGDAHKKNLVQVVEQIQQEKIRYQNLQQKIKTAESLFSNAIESMQGLSQQCDFVCNAKHEKTILYFLERNWGKMLLGALVAAGLTGGLGVFFALGVIILATAAVAAFVIGASLGLMSGVLMERTPKPVVLTEEGVDKLMGYASMAPENATLLDAKGDVKGQPIQQVEKTIEQDDDIQKLQQLQQLKVEPAKQESKVSDSVFALFPSTERLKQGALQKAPAPLLQDRQVILKVL